MEQRPGWVAATSKPWVGETPVALPAFWGGENLVGVRYIRRCGTVDVACDHTTEKIPDPVRSPQSSSVGLAEYCGGRPHGNGQCCRPFFFLFFFASFSGSLSLVLLFRSTCSTFCVIAYAMPIVSLRMTRSSYLSESLAGWHLKCASTRYCCVSFSFPRFFFFSLHTHLLQFAQVTTKAKCAYSSRWSCLSRWRCSLLSVCPALPCLGLALPCSALPWALLCLALGLALPFPALPCRLPCRWSCRLPCLPCLALPCATMPYHALPRAAPPCPALPCPALPCPALPYTALPCPALPYPTLPYPALPCPCLACPCLALPLPCLSEPTLLLCLSAQSVIA